MHTMTGQLDRLWIIDAACGRDGVSRSALLTAHKPDAAAFSRIGQFGEACDLGAVCQIEVKTIRIRWIRRTSRFPIVREEVDGDFLFHGLNSRRS